MKTLYLSIIAIMFSSCFVLSNTHAQDCMGGPFCEGNTAFAPTSNRNVTVSLNFNSNYTLPNNVHYLWLRFFDATNDTLIKNVSFFINATKDNKVLMHQLFYTKTGFMLMKFHPDLNTGKLIINGTSEPTLGGMMSENDTLPITTSVFATNGTYHIHLEVLTIDYPNNIIDQSNPPKFDSWWSVDDKGNISQYDNSIISFGSTIPSVKIKNESPLKQFKSGIAVNHITCKKDLRVILKAENSFPACVDMETGKKLVQLGWATEFEMNVYDYWSTCDKSIPQSNSSTAVFYMPTNAIGKICLSYSNPNSEPEPVTPPGIHDPNNSYQTPKDITIWTYTPISTIANDNGTVVAYFIKTGNQTGFYGLSLPSCEEIPFAVGYNNDSKITSNDFPFLGVTVSCPPGMLYPQLDGIEGIGVKYIPYP